MENSKFVILLKHCKSQGFGILLPGGTNKFFILDSWILDPGTQDAMLLEPNGEEKHRFRAFLRPSLDCHCFFIGILLPKNLVIYSVWAKLQILSFSENTNYDDFFRWIWNFIEKATSIKFQNRCKNQCI